MGSHFIQEEYRNHPFIKELKLDKYPYNTNMLDEIIDRIEKGDTIEEIIVLINNNDLNQCDKCFWWTDSEQLYWEGYDFNEDYEDEDNEYDTMCEECFPSSPFYEKNG